MASCLLRKEPESFCNIVEKVGKDLPGLNFLDNLISYLKSIKEGEVMQIVNETDRVNTVQPEIKSVTVFCSCSQRLDPGFYETAKIIGKTLAERGITFVYGGGGVGIMGKAAIACKEAGGKVIGIPIREYLDDQKEWDGQDELIIAESMNERK